jgi:hypothetical protein
MDEGRIDDDNMCMSKNEIARIKKTSTSETTLLLYKFTYAELSPVPIVMSDACIMQANIKKLIWLTDQCNICMRGLFEEKR